MFDIKRVRIFEGTKEKLDIASDMVLTHPLRREGNSSAQILKYSSRNPTQWKDHSIYYLSQLSCYNKIPYQGVGGW